MMQINSNHHSTITNCIIVLNVFALFCWSICSFISFCMFAQISIIFTMRISHQFLSAHKFLLMCRWFISISSAFHLYFIAFSKLMSHWQLISILLVSHWHFIGVSFSKTNAKIEPMGVLVSMQKPMKLQVLQGHSGKRVIMWNFLCEFKNSGKEKQIQLKDQTLAKFLLEY